MGGIPTREAARAARDARLGQQRSHNIDNQIGRSHVEARLELLIAGSDGVGKSSFMKQMRILHGDVYTQLERLHWGKMISNYIIGMSTYCLSCPCGFPLPTRLHNMSCHVCDVSIVSMQLLVRFQIPSADSLSSKAPSTMSPMIIKKDGEQKVEKDGKQSDDVTTTTTAKSSDADTTSTSTTPSMPTHSTPIATTSSVIPATPVVADAKADVSNNDSKRTNDDTIVKESDNSSLSSDTKRSDVIASPSSVSSTATMTTTPTASSPTNDPAPSEIPLTSVPLATSNSSYQTSHLLKTMMTSNNGIDITNDRLDDGDSFYQSARHRIDNELYGDEMIDIHLAAQLACVWSSLPVQRSYRWLLDHRIEAHNRLRSLEYFIHRLPSVAEANAHGMAIKRQERRQRRAVAALLANRGENSSSSAAAMDDIKRLVHRDNNDESPTSGSAAVAAVALAVATANAMNDHNNDDNGDDDDDEDASILRETSWQATNEDIVRCPLPSCRPIDTLEVTIGGNIVRAVQPFGQRNEHKKWLHCFERWVPLYIVDLSLFDMTAEDDYVPHLERSLTDFRDRFVQSRWFRDSRAVVVMFNGVDAFRTRLLRDDPNNHGLSSVWPDYTGPSPSSVRHGTPTDQNNMITKAWQEITTRFTRLEDPYCHRNVLMVPDPSPVIASMTNTPYIVHSINYLVEILITQHVQHAQDHWGLW
jgi:hypothetical protein